MLFWRQHRVWFWAPALRVHCLGQAPQLPHWLLSQVLETDSTPWQAYGEKWVKCGRHLESIRCETSSISASQLLLFLPSLVLPSLPGLLESLECGWPWRPDDPSYSLKLADPTRINGKENAIVSFRSLATERPKACSSSKWNHILAMLACLRSWTHSQLLMWQVRLKGHLPRASARPTSSGCWKMKIRPVETGFVSPHHIHL